MVYADAIQIYVDASKDAVQLQHLLPRQLPHLNWDATLQQYVSISPNIRFLIECGNNKDIELHRQRLEDEHRYLIYPVIIEMWTFTDLDLSHPQVLADQKQIAQTLITFFKSQGWKTGVVSIHLDDDDFE